MVADPPSEASPVVAAGLPIYNTPYSALPATPLHAPTAAAAVHPILPQHGMIKVGNIVAPQGSLSDPAARSINRWAAFGQARATQGLESIGMPEPVAARDAAAMTTGAAIGAATGAAITGVPSSVLGVPGALVGGLAGAIGGAGVGAAAGLATPPVIGAIPGALAGLGVGAGAGVAAGALGPTLAGASVGGVPGAVIGGLAGLASGAGDPGVHVATHVNAPQTPAHPVTRQTAPVTPRQVAPQRAKALAAPLRPAVAQPAVAKPAVAKPAVAKWIVGGQNNWPNAAHAPVANHPVAGHGPVANHGPLGGAVHLAVAKTIPGNVHR